MIVLIYPVPLQKNDNILVKYRGCSGVVLVDINELLRCRPRWGLFSNDLCILGTLNPHTHTTIHR